VSHHHWPPRARQHLSEGMRLAALRHTQMVEELAVLRVVMSSATESVLEHLPSDTFSMEVVGELVVEFQKMEDRRSRHERPTQGSVICSLDYKPVGPDWSIS
jgi:hypothetical protein